MELPARKELLLLIFGDETVLAKCILVIIQPDTNFFTFVNFLAFCDEKARVLIKTVGFCVFNPMFNCDISGAAATAAIYREVPPCTALH